MPETSTSLPALFDLTGRRALVTGAAGHLGRAFARALAEAGAAVWLNGRDEAALENLRNELAGDGLAAEVAAFDVTDEAACRRWFEGPASAAGRLDILVNNAYAGRDGGLWQAESASFAEAAEITLGAAHRLMKLGRPLLERAVAEAGQASVVNIASMYGLVSPDPRIYPDEGSVNPPAYSAAKAALLQFTRTAACQLAPLRIRVNAISPGPFPPEAVTEAAPAFHKALCDKVPLGRVGRPDELGGAVVFLASDAASYVTGANLVVDGGWTAW